MKNELMEVYNALMQISVKGESIGHMHRALMILSMVINNLPDDTTEEQ